MAIATPFSWREAVLSGFGLVARRPLAAFCWALAFFLGDTAKAAAQLWAVRSFPADFSIMAMWISFSNLGLTLVVGVGVATAVLRAALGPGARRAGWAGFGADALRVALLALPLILAQFLSTGVTLGLAITLSGGEASLGSGFVVLRAIGLAILMLLGARLALAAPMTIADGRLRLAASAKLTRGHHLRLATILVAALFLSTMLEVAGDLVSHQIPDVFAREHAVSAAQVAPSEANDIVVTASAATDSNFGLAATLSRMLGAIVHALAVAVQLTPLAYAYRRLGGDPVENRAAVFD